ncbi:MAG: hypothetical protein SVY10_20575, partial [Thermodesulfobacteriota bacterium]|nr:hypothetical protein [Thermodesulfobacteriota bacterium]
PLVTLPAWNVTEMHSHVDAQFLARYPFAAAAFRIQSGADWQKKETLENPDIKDFLERVEVCAHPEYGRKILDDPRLPLSKVEVIARGKVLQEEKDWKKGNPWPEKARMSDDELTDKFRNNAMPILGEESTEKAIDLIMNMEDNEDVSLLMDKLRVS